MTDQLRNQVINDRSRPQAKLPDEVGQAPIRPVSDRESPRDAG